MKVGRESSGIPRGGSSTGCARAGYADGITIGKDDILAARHREVFVPLRYDPGHAQMDVAGRYRR